MSWVTYIERGLCTRKTRLAILSDNLDGSTDLVSPMSFQKVQEGVEIKPALEGSTETVLAIIQSIVDAAWEEGIKPRGLEDNRNELTATKAHLEDMKLAYKVLLLNSEKGSSKEQRGE